MNEIKNEILTYPYCYFNYLDVHNEKHEKLINNFIKYLNKICQSYVDFQIKIQEHFVYPQDISLVFSREDTDQYYDGFRIYTTNSTLYSILALILERITCFLFLNPQGFRLDICYMQNFYFQGLEFIEQEEYYV